MKFQYDRRQLRAMCFVASLAPVTRLLPKAAAQLAGSASWLAPLCALPPLLLFLLILTSLMKMRREGEGLGAAVGWAGAWLVQRAEQASARRRA